MLKRDIAIVGCGPIGALMANLLAARGIGVIVIERAPDVYQLPRAIGMDDEIMRVFQAAKLEAVNTERVYTLRGMDLLRRNRSHLRRISIEHQPVTLGHPIFTLFHQPTLEANIRKGLNRFPELADVRLGHEVRDIRDLGDRIELDFGPTDTEQTETVSAQYVLGCDGGRSTVRRCFNVTQEDLGLHQPWVVVDAIMKRPIETTGFAEQICDPKRPSTFIPAPEPRKRWEFMVMPGDDQDELVTPEKLNELIRPWASPDDYEIERAVIYTFHALIARQWRMGKTGRAFILGDAAHQMPPFLGQGMCAGIRDTFNLVWKLDLVLRGDANPDLLDTYQTERADHVRGVIQLAVRIGKIIQSPSRVWSYLSNALMVFMERVGLDLPMETAKSLPIGDGFFSKDFGPDAKQRCPFPQPRVTTSDGATIWLDECLGNDFALLTRDATNASEPLITCVHVVANNEQAKDAAIIDTEGVLLAYMNEHNCDAVLLRPDRQVFGLYAADEATPAFVADDLKAHLRASNNHPAQAAV